jgi:hypothetical protein
MTMNTGYMTNSAEPLWDAQQSFFDQIADLFDFTDVNDLTIEVPQARAAVKTYSAEEIAWLARVDMQVPSAGFRTMRYTATPNLRTDIPHLTVEFGTVPNFFVYIDFVPRLDPLANPDYLYGKLYDWLDENRKRLADKDGFVAFKSEERYLRAFMSPCAIVFTCDANQANAELIASLGQEALSLWLGNLISADWSRDTAYDAKDKRDFVMLKTAVQRDPGAVFAGRLFGEESVIRLQDASTPPENFHID